MIDRIEIDNFATIDHVSFDLGPSLDIITGETGAGKSILVEAVSTALGGRADISMIRSGCDKAVIQIVCTKNDETFIIIREIMSSGKSISKLNGEIVSLGQLKEFCSSLVDIHGQYDNQQILNSDNHIYITDSYKNASIKEELAKLKVLYEDYHSAKKAYDDLIAKEQAAKSQKDFYNFEFEYIDRLNLEVGEDEKLHESLNMMKNSEKIFSAVNGSYQLIHESDNSVLSALNTSMNELSSVSSYSDEINTISKTLGELYYTLSDISDELRTLCESMNFEESDIDSLSERLSQIEDAKRKYNKSIEDIIAYKDELSESLSLIENFDIEKEKLKEEMDARYENLKEKADYVSDLRHLTAARLESSIIKELQDLEFANSDFKIEITKSEEISPIGYDRIEFLISTNPGEPLRPLTKIASGGEISRIMLAFKHIIGDDDQVQTMIFDEIDTGISGKTALIVGKKLKEIAMHHQVICITHLPQIAAYGQENYNISKDIESGKSVTRVNHLDYEGKLHTIANLISGNEESDTALHTARELIESSDI